MDLHCPPRPFRGHAGAPRRVAAALLLLSAAAPAGAETFATCDHFINAVPATLSSAGVYCLVQDVITGVTTGAAITVASNNVTLDCNGYKIGGMAAGPDTEAIGVSIDGGGGLGTRANFLMRNCSVRGFATGLWSRGAPGLVIEDNRFEQIRKTGVDLIYPPGFILRRNLISDTGGPGSHIAVNASGDGGEVSDNLIRNTYSTDGGSAYGLVGGNCRGCVISGNRILGLAGGNNTGMTLGPSGINAEELRVVGNTITRLDGVGTGFAGIQADGLCKDNTINGSFSIAVGCEASAGNLINP